MDTQARTTDFFRAGGTLPPSAPSYIKRPADDELLEQLLAGRFCYVLTSRQRGKSSMMIRTAEKLRQEGVATAIVDLSGLGTRVSQDQWYLGIITRLVKDLQLSVESEQWWRERSALGPVQRFTDFLHDRVLAELSGSVVIFFDEIDSTLNIVFSDDFFAAIRGMYNLRATHPEYDRLTFVLLGVAAPTDLITDRKRTPFNIGYAVELQELSREDARLLEHGLEQVYPGNARRMLDRIFYWTNGHPYLTQKLCSEIAEQETTDWSDEQIDALVSRLFLTEDARKESNLQFVRSSIVASPERRRLLSLYRQIYLGKSVPEDERSAYQKRLGLSGLTRVEGGTLKVRNEIYRRVFDLDWIKANTPINWTLIASIVATGLTLAALITAIALLQQQRASKIAEQVTFASEQFRESSDADVRMSYLSLLCSLKREEAQALFTKLPLEEQWALFDKLHAEDAKDSLVAVVQCLYPAVETFSQIEPRKRLEKAMSCALVRSGRADIAQLRQQIGYTGLCAEEQYSK